MSNNKRSGKFYRKNEKEVMESLGFKPTPNSGSGWISKEDGENEFALCQLKSTDATTIKVCQKDIETLEYNALVSHKLPVFAIQFLNTNEVFLLIRPELLNDLNEAIKTKRYINNQEEFLGILKQAPEAQSGTRKKDISIKKIKSSTNSHKGFMKINDDRYKKKSKSAI